MAMSNLNAPGRALERASAPQTIYSPKEERRDEPRKRGNDHEFTKHGTSPACSAVVRALYQGNGLRPLPVALLYWIVHPRPSQRMAKHNAAMLLLY